MAAAEGQQTAAMASSKQADDGQPGLVAVAGRPVCHSGLAEWSMKIWDKWSKKIRNALVGVLISLRISFTLFICYSIGLLGMKAILFLSMKAVFFLGYCL